MRRHASLAARIAWVAVFLFSTPLAIAEEQQVPTLVRSAAPTGRNGVVLAAMASVMKPASCHRGLPADRNVSERSPASAEATRRRSSSTTPFTLPAMKKTI